MRLSVMFFRFEGLKVQNFRLWLQSPEIKRLEFHTSELRSSEIQRF
jgi:hypothetical protein